MDGLSIAMKKYTYGNPSAPIILVQMVDDHDLSVIESEIDFIRELSGTDFCLTAFQVNSWNNDLSPWESPAVFGKEGFGCGAEDTLKSVLVELSPMDQRKTYFIGGYSLSGLFALWSAYQTDVFTGVAAASPSVWFPGFLDYMKKCALKTGSVYLSLGDREERARNPVIAKVGSCIREAQELLLGAGADCVLEWNSGNHFREPDLRTAKAFAWLLQNK